MSLRPGWRKLLRLPPLENRLQRDVDDEFAFHISMREERLRREGAAPDSARMVARARFGDADRLREEVLTIDRRYVREVRIMEWLQSLAADIRYAMRTMRRMPAFTAIATITLALGIGATTAMFTLVNGILIRPLPYPHADRLVRLIQSYPEKGLPTWGISQQNIALYRDGTTDFEAFTAYRGGSITILGNSAPAPERLAVMRVTSEFFRVIGVNPSIGRAFTADEDKPRQNNVIVLSHGTWQTRFGGDPAVIGTTLDVDGQPTQVIGVMPAGFSFPRAGVQAWLPMGLDPLRRGGYMNSGLGLLKPGVTPQHAERETTAIMWQWARDEGGFVGGSDDPSKTHMKTIVQPLQSAITSRSARPLTVLLAAVSLILLIATANVATLLSSRAAKRRREISLRTALGASGARVLRQLLTESVALALLGAVAGVGLAVGGVRLFTRSSLAALPRIDEVTVDWQVLAFTLAVSVLSGVLFGILPAAHVLRSSLAGDLASGARESGHRTTRRLNNGLVVAQLALSVVLVIAAGLVLKSFQRITDMNLGFRTDGITSLTLPLPPKINSATTETAFMDATLQRVRAMPGVEGAALAWSLPFEGRANYDGYLIDGRSVPASGNEDQTYQVGVSPGYFALLGIPLRYGRDFAASDDSSAVPVGIVDETLANRFWNGAEALGKRIRTTGDTTRFTIIGVVGGVYDGDPTEPLRPHLYVSIPQNGGNPLSLAVRSARGATVIPAVRRVLAELEPTMPLDAAATLDTIVDQTLATRRLTKLLLAGFAMLAVLLAGVGIYGVMSLHVASRTREFGIRLAIGANPRQLLRLVLMEGATLAALGVAIGIVGALGATRWIAALLFGVSATDPVTYAGLSVLLAAIAVAACLVPARRAAQSDPLVALRTD